MTGDENVEFDDTAPDPSSDDHRFITIERFRQIEVTLRQRGFGDEIDNAERRSAPTDADAFALEIVFVIVNCGMSRRVAGPIYERCVTALQQGLWVGSFFGHFGKAQAIDRVWQQREQLFVEFANSADTLAFCASLPFVGPVTKYHLAKNFGGNFVKPDVHIARLAAAAGVTPWQLCHRLARATGYRKATVDTILWRACVEQLLDSRAMVADGTMSI